MNITNISKYPFLLEYFEDISAIPRMSYHEEGIADFICDFAAKRGYEFYKDSANNVLVNIPATEGYEKCEPIMLQGHTDMVCEKENGVEHDFLRDGIELYEENGFLKARGTTLGGDDGVAVIIMMALIDGRIAEHPRCQCLFTTAEEVGLDGAKVFDYSRIFARKAINIDNSDENSIIVGCSGGVRSDLSFKIKYAERSRAQGIKITVGGLMGGHSGENIGEGRQNSNIIVLETLRRLLSRGDAELISLCGGSKDNAIPRSAEAVIFTDDPMAAEEICRDTEGKIRPRINDVDKGFYISCEPFDSVGDKVMENDFSISLIELLLSIENGVLKMSEEISGLVEFSRNFAVIATEGDFVRVCFSTRSAKDEQIELSINELREKAESMGAEISHRGRYPGWDYPGYSPLADKYIEAARRVCGLEVEKTTIHAGLECGIMKQAIPDLEMISCGPNCPDLHSPSERLEIASLNRVFEIIGDVLKRKDS